MSAYPYPLRRDTRPRLRWPAMLAVCALSAHAADWVPYAVNPSETWEYRAGSIADGSVNNGPARVAVVRRVRDSEELVFRAAVPKSQCSQRMGDIYLHTLAGALVEQSAWIAGSATTAAITQRLLCGPRVAT